ncbi:MAG: sulfotransferase [Flavobacteriales bacterium]|jgi:hypothetical protein|nr:sulfotransferase [Flavobacteriales bacterium]
MKQKVNLFLVGAMRAGTTELVGLLRQHPQIYVPPIKEPNFFANSLPKNIYKPSKFFSEADYFKNNFPDPLHIAQLKNEMQYQKLFSLAENEKYLLDASTAYLHAPEAVERIYNYNPKAKIIIVVRDPIQRAFSHFKMDLALGRVTGSFNKIILKEIDAFRSGKLPWNSYLGMSIYEPHIARFTQTFKSVLIIKSSELFKDKDSTMLCITEFLEISGFNFLDSLSSYRNEAKQLRFQKIFYILKQAGLKDYFSKILSVSVRQKLFRVVSKKAKNETLISEELRVELKEIFENDYYEVFHKQSRIE